jgi:hypothetical protein
MSSGRSSAGSLDLHDRTLRAYLESHGIDPDAFAELPDDMQAEFLQSLPDNFGNTLGSATLAGSEAGCASVDEGSVDEGSVDEGSPSPRERVQQVAQGFEPDSALISDSSCDDADSYRESVGYESDNSAVMQSDQPWMQPQHAAPGLHHRSSHRGQAHHEQHILAPPLNPELRELLESHGIDADAFADMPDDIQSEILRTIPDLEDSASAGYISGDNSESDLYMQTSLQERDSERPSLSLRPSPAVAPPPTDSRVIFSMGFDPALVTRALGCIIPSPQLLLNCAFFLTSSSPLIHSATRDDEAQAVEMLLSGSVPSPGSTSTSALRPSPGFVQQRSPRAAGPSVIPHTPRPPPSPPQSRQDAVLEALHSRVLTLIFC